MEQKILDVKQLKIDFSVRGRAYHAIRDISMEVYRGETLAIVGESGSGKSVFTKSFMGLLEKNGKISGGKIQYYGKKGCVNLAAITKESRWCQIRGKEIAMILQDPMTSLNPLKTIGNQILEAVYLQQKVNRKEAREKVYRYLKEVGIDEPKRRFGQYPHEFSGGMRQRVVIATAIACRPNLLICDEPTTALDVTIQAQILELLKNLKKKYHLTILLITHDMGIVASSADRIAVMYAGDIIEVGTTTEIFYEPKHPYTWALLSALPQMGRKGEVLYAIPGSPPNLFQEIKGDAFAARNPQALEIDFLKRPPYFWVSKTHGAKTWLLDARAPNVCMPNAVEQIRNGVWNV